MDDRYHRRFRLGDEEDYSRKRVKRDRDVRYHRQFRLGDEEDYSRKRVKRDRDVRYHRQFRLGDEEDYSRKREKRDRDVRYHRQFRLGDEEDYSRKREKRDVDDRYHQRFRLSDEEEYSRKRVKRDMDERYHWQFRLGDEEEYSRKRVKRDIDDRYHRRFRLGDEEEYSRKREKGHMDDRHQWRFRLGDEEVFSWKKRKMYIPRQRVKAEPPKMTIEDWPEYIDHMCHKIFFSPHVENDDYSSSLWGSSRMWGSRAFLGIEKLHVENYNGIETMGKQIFNERFIIIFKNYFESLIDFEKRLHDMLKHYKSSEEKKQNWILQRCQERYQRIVSNSDRISLDILDSLSYKYLSPETVKTCIEYLFNYYDDELMIFLCKLVKKLKTDQERLMRKKILDEVCLDSYCQRLYGLVDNANVSMKVKTKIQKMQEILSRKNLENENNSDLPLELEKLLDGY